MDSTTSRLAASPLRVKKEEERGEQVWGERREDLLQSGEAPAFPALVFPPLDWSAFQAAASLKTRCLPNPWLNIPSIPEEASLRRGWETRRQGQPRAASWRAGRWQGEAQSGGVKQLPLPLQAQGFPASHPTASSAANRKYTQVRRQSPEGEDSAP